MKNLQLKSHIRTFTDKSIILIAALLLLFSVIASAVLFQNFLEETKKQITRTGFQIQSLFQYEINIREYLVEVLRSASEFYLDDKTQLNENVLDFLESYQGKDGYTLKMLPGYNEGELGNLTGLGEIPKGGSPASREISMAISLSPIFQSMIQKDPDIPWIYYTSLEGFMYLYPRVEPDEFFFSEHLFTYDFVVGVLPENNPEREIFWSPIYLDDAGKGFMTTISAPIYKEDKILGMVSIDTHIRKLKWLIHSYLAYSSTTHLINSKGVDLLDDSHPEFNLNPKDFSPGVTTSYQGEWITIYNLAAGDWYLLLKTDKSAVLWRALGESLPLFLILLFFTGFLILIYFLLKTLKAVEKLSTRDPLTSIWNRYVFDNMTKHHFAYAKRQGTKFGIIIIDIDSFKKFNDSFGHPAGDRVLIKVAQCLNRFLLRETDHVFRVGGEEFAVLTLTCTEPQFSMLLEELRAAVFSLNIPHRVSPNGRLTISLGGYIVNSQFNEVFNDAYQKADKALYKAKSGGKNRYEIYKDLTD